MGLNEEEMEAAAQKGRRRALEFIAKAQQNAEDERKTREEDKDNEIKPDEELTIGVPTGKGWKTKDEPKDAEGGVGVYIDGKWVNK